MSYNFGSKVAVVTGGLSGIGLSISKRLLLSNAKVAISDLSSCDKFDSVLKELESDGVNPKDVIYVQADASKEEDNKRLVAETLSSLGGLDIVCANAGIATFAKNTHEISFEQWKKVTSINLDGVFILNKLAIDYWLENNKEGVIVNTGSIHSFVAAPGLAHYGATKGGVKLLTETLALEFASKGIRVNSVNPGYILTPLLEGLPKEKMDYLVTQHPIGRLGTPEEVANAVAFLCSDQATFIHGISLLVDGGYTAR